MGEDFWLYNGAQPSGGMPLNMEQAQLAQGLLGDMKSKNQANIQNMVNGAEQANQSLMAANQNLQANRAAQMNATENQRAQMEAQEKARKQAIMGLAITAATGGFGGFGGNSVRPDKEIFLLE